MATSGATHVRLLDEFSSAIDSSTLLAILSDYDLSKPHDVDAARQTLDILKEASQAEDASGFDPSGVSGFGHASASNRNNDFEDDRGSSTSLPDWKSNPDTTSLSADISSLSLGVSEYNGSETGQPKDVDLEAITQFELDLSGDETEEQHLAKMFPVLKPFDVRWTLKKCKGNVGLAIDELMTQSFLEEAGMRRRGVEAFSEDEYRSQPRRKVKKKRNTSGQQISNNSPPGLVAQDSKWDVAKRDVDFIASKTDMPTQQVSSIYHSNGASVRQTIRGIMEAHKQLKIPNDSMEIQAIDLGQEFPSLPLMDLVTLLQITPSVANFRELAKVLVSVSPEPLKPRIQIELRHGPLNLHSATDKAKPPPHSPRTAPDIATSSALARTYHTARDHAFVQASAAYRRGKSDHLMGGAAAYYSQVGRDFDARAKSAESAMADALVASQSTKTFLDLHGVNVKDAVRLSRERVTNWWHELGEESSGGKGVGSGYKIVTGVGNHSEGGKVKLGPAVGKMLVREGWKVQVGSGMLVVTGVVKK